MPYAELTLPRPHRRPDDDDAAQQEGLVGFVDRLTDVLAEACGRQRRFIVVRISYADSFAEGKPLSHGWIMHLTASDILVEESNRRRISAATFDFMRAELGELALPHGRIFFHDTPNGYTVMGTTWQDVYEHLLEAKRRRHLDRKSDAGGGGGGGGGGGDEGGSGGSGTAWQEVYGNLVEAERRQRGRDAGQADDAAGGGGGGGGDGGSGDGGPGGGRGPGSKL